VYLLPNNEIRHIHNELKVASVFENLFDVVPIVSTLNKRTIVTLH